MKISTILSKKGSDVITIHPDQTVQDAVSQMAGFNIGALVVVNDEGELVGIVSERDVIRVAARQIQFLQLSVRSIMTAEVVTAVPQDDIISVANTMTEARFRHLPICQDGMLIGIISIGDVLKLQRDQYLGEIDTLETQIIADE